MIFTSSVINFWEHSSELRVQQPANFISSLSINNYWWFPHPSLLFTKVHISTTLIEFQILAFASRPFSSILHLCYFWCSLAFLVCRTFVLAMSASHIYEESRLLTKIINDIPSEFYGCEVRNYFFTFGWEICCSDNETAKRAKKDGIFSVSLLRLIW